MGRGLCSGIWPRVCSSLASESGVQRPDRAAGLWLSEPAWEMLSECAGGLAAVLSLQEDAEMGAYLFSNVTCMGQTSAFLTDFSSPPKWGSTLINFSLC